MFLQMGIQSADSCETCITIFAFEGFCIAMNTATVSRDFTPSKSDQSWIYFRKTQGQGVKTSVTAAPKSILRGCELRYGPLGVHRLC